MLKRVALLLIAACLSTQFVTAESPELPEAATETKPIKAGTQLPEARVRALNGSERTLAEVADNKPAAIVFYRGSWCPYCTTHLQGLKEAMPDLAALGVQLIAVSPDKAENIAKMVEKEELPYTLVSDSSLAAARSLGIAFRLDDATREKYAEYGIDLEEASGESHYGLPVPTVLLVDKSGTIRFVHAEPDYTKRLDNEALIEAAREMSGK